MASPQQVTDQQITQWNAQLQNDPEFKRLLAAFNQALTNAQNIGTRQNKSTPEQRDAIVKAAQEPLRQYLRSRYGIDASQQGMLVDAGSGQLKRDHTNRDSALIIGGILGGGYGASLLPGVGAAATAPAASSAGGVGIGETAAVTGLGSAGSAGGLASGLGKYLPYIISDGSAIVGSVLQNRAQNKATDAQTKAAEDALALNREMFGKQLEADEITRRQEYDRYTQSRADSEPYRALGKGAVGSLSYLSGLTPGPAETPIPYTPGPTLSSMGSPAVGTPTTPTNSGNLQSSQVGSGMVPVRSPQGQVVNVPQERLQEALANGGQRV